MRSVNNWAVAAVFAGALAFATPLAAQTAGGQAGGQAGGTGQTGATTGGQAGTGSDTGSGKAASAATGSQPKQSDAQKFVTQAAISNMAEIQLGQLAQQKAQDPQVKQFAQTMIDQHTQAENQLQQMASANGLTVPSSLDKKHQAIHDKLAKLDGARFDRQYIKDMVAAHQEAQKLLQKQANRTGAAPASAEASGTAGTSGTSVSAGAAVGTSGQAGAIDQYASTTLPQVQQHLQMARDLLPQVKNEGKNSKSDSNKVK